VTLMSSVGDGFDCGKISRLFRNLMILFVEFGMAWRLRE